MDELAHEYEGSVKVAKVDVDSESALAGHFGISRIPTIAFFEPGEEPKAVAGAMPKEMVESAFGLDRFAKRSEERRVGEECRSRWSADHLKKKRQISMQT